MPSTRTSRYSAYKSPLESTEAPTGVRSTRGANDVKDVSDVSTDLKLEINRYLFHELITGENEGEVSARWPFRLREVPGITEEGEPRIRVFRFRHEGSSYFVEAGRTFSFWLGAGMSIEDLRLYIRGTSWIARQEPVDLDVARPGEPGIPLVAERRRKVEVLAVTSLQSSGEGDEVGVPLQVQILEGLFFPSHNRYLALVEVEGEGEGQEFVVGSGVAVHTVEEPGIAPWRQLVSVIGKMLESGELDGW